MDSIFLPSHFSANARPQLQTIQVSISTGIQTLENYITRFAEAEAPVACSSGIVFPLHVEANAAAIYIRFTECFNVHEESAEYALAAKMGIHIDTLDPPDLAVSPIAPFESMRGLPYDFTVDLSHEIPSPAGFRNEASDSVGYCYQIEFPSFGFTAERDVKVGDGFHVGGNGQSDPNHGSFRQRLPCI